MTAPPTIATLLQQGLFHHQQGQFAQAMERYTDVLRIDPQNAEALYYVAAIACQEGQYPRASRSPAARSSKRRRRHACTI